MKLPDLDTPLLNISSHRWTYRDACAGTGVLGATSSGKTSSTGTLLLRTFMRHGAGGLILCSKPSERARIEALASEEHREESLIIVSPHTDKRHQRQWCINLLNYEYSRSGSGAQQIEAIVEVVTTIKRLVSDSQDGSEDGSHWQRASDQLIRYAVLLLTLSGTLISMDSITQLIMDAPEGEEADEPQWQRENFFWKTYHQAEKQLQTPRDEHNFRMAKRYWLQTYAGLADRTRSSVYSTFAAMSDVLLHPPIYDLFSTETNLVPEVCYRDAAIIVLDMPVREYGKAGIIAQRLFKYIWQRAMLRRDVVAHPRPVFLYCDEAQNFVDEFDFLFQAESRESRVATVYITQNISNYYAVLGSRSHDEVNALLGHFQTKVFHSNADSVTNQWAAETIGYTHRFRRSWSLGHTELGNNYFSFGGSEQREFKVEPSAFTLLRQGGAVNNWEVDAFLLTSGKEVPGEGDSWMKVTLRQEFTPRPQVNVAPEMTLSREQKMTLFMHLFDLLLIFLHHGSVMDMYQAMQWEQDTIVRPERPGPEIRATVTCDESVFSVPNPNIEATVRWAFASN